MISDAKNFCEVKMNTITKTLRARISRDHKNTPQIILTGWPEADNTVMSPQQVKDLVAILRRIADLAKSEGINRLEMDYSFSSEEDVRN